MRRLAVVLSVLTMLPALALAQATTARAQLDAFARNLHALSGDFEQSLSTGSGPPAPPSHGTLALQAPHQFRWDTVAPYRQNIVADGSRVWLYDPELQQVTVRRQDGAEAHSPLTVLTDLSQLDKQFHVTERGEHDGFSWLRLTSTAADPAFDWVDLGFSNGLLGRMVFRDQAQVLTQIQFSHWQRNPTFKPGSFSFVAPKGTDVVGDAPDIQIQPLQN